MNECQFQPRLSAYYDQELDAPTARELQSHLANCATCREELDGIRIVSRAIQSVPTRDMSQIGMARLHKTADAATRRRDVLPFAKPLIAIAASVLVIAGAWLMELPSSHPTGPGITGTQQPEDWEKLACGDKIQLPGESETEIDSAVAWMMQSLDGKSGL